MPKYSSIKTSTRQEIRAYSILQKAIPRIDSDLTIYGVPRGPAYRIAIVPLGQVKPSEEGAFGRISELWVDSVATGVTVAILEAGKGTTGMR